MNTDPINDAAHLLVSSHHGCLGARRIPDTWHSGFWKGRRAAAKLILRWHATTPTNRRRVARFVRFWVDRYRLDLARARAIPPVRARA